MVSFAVAVKLAGVIVSEPNAYDTSKFSFINPAGTTECVPTLKPVIRLMVLKANESPSGASTSASSMMLTT